MRHAAKPWVGEIDRAIRAHAQIVRAVQLLALEMRVVEDAAEGASGQLVEFRGVLEVVLHRIRLGDVVARLILDGFHTLARRSNKRKLIVEVDGVLVLVRCVDGCFSDHPAGVGIVGDAEPSARIEDEFRAPGPGLVFEVRDDTPTKILLAPRIPLDVVGVDAALTKPHTNKLAQAAMGTALATEADRRRLGAARDELALGKHRASKPLDLGLLDPRLGRHLLER